MSKGGRSDLPELFIGVKRGIFRKDDPHAPKSDQVFAENRKKVLIRDKCTCQFCNFQSKKFQEVHHIDDNHDNNELNNLVTACPLCHQVHHIWFAGKHRSGTLVYIPDFTQAELINLTRTLWIAQMSSDIHIKKYAELLENNIRLTGQSAVKEKIDTHDPCVLGEIFQQLSPAEYLARTERMRGYHLMPLKQAFTKQIQYWLDHVYADLNPESWLEKTEEWYREHRT